MARVMALAMQVALMVAAVVGAAAASAATSAPAGASGAALVALAEAPIEGSTSAAPVAREVPYIAGPRRVLLGDGIEIDLPPGTVLLEGAQARALLEAQGNSSERVLGLVARTDRRWVVVIEHAPIGYVTDADAGELEPGALLASFRAGTEQQNERRRARGLPELVIDGWSEPPRYERATHRLLWGIRGHAVDTVQEPRVNFFTRVLGRDGYLSLELIDEPSTIEQAKLEAAALVGAIRFQPGSRYEDYREGDKTSGMGLRMLVLGGAGETVANAAEPGILATILLTLKKFFLVIGLAIAALLKWLLDRRSRPPAAPVPATPADANANANADAGPYAI